MKDRRILQLPPPAVPANWAPFAAWIQTPQAHRALQAVARLAEHYERIEQLHVTATGWTQGIVSADDIRAIGHLLWMMARFTGTPQAQADIHDD